MDFHLDVHSAVGSALLLTDNSFGGAVLVISQFFRKKTFFYYSSGHYHASFELYTTFEPANMYIKLKRRYQIVSVEVSIVVRNV